jgi:glycosyltransferase involved in cell wall biosynthesis
MKKVIFRGPALTQSGYGVHSRQVAKWLLSRNDIEVKFLLTPWGDTPWILDRSSNDGLIGQIMDRTVNPEYKSDVSVQLQLPNEWDPNLSKTNIGITASVETDLANVEWVSACNKMSCVVVPSEHALKSLQNAAEISVPTHVIPESFCDEITSACEQDSIDLSNVETKFNFLVFGQMTGNNPFNDRKNLLFTIKWLCETFSKDEDVGIIIKTNSGRNTKIDRNIVTRNLESLSKEVRKSVNPKIYLLHGEMKDAQIASLYKNEKVKALVTLTRGEGYGLPILEAAASGLPVIATNWSGHLDFMKHTKFIEIDYVLKEIHQSRIDNKIFVRNSKWAEPIESDFKKKILKFRSGSEIPKEWAIKGSKKIIELYNHKEISKIYDEKLSEYLVTK